MRNDTHDIKEKVLIMLQCEYCELEFSETKQGLDELTFHILLTERRNG